MQLLKKILSFIDQRVEEFGGAQYKTFGLFGIINYPLCYFILQFLGTNESFIARFFAAFLCTPLIFVKQWPLTLKKYVNLYWILTLLYCIPVFGIYGLLKNHASTDWLLNLALGLFILFLLVDYVLLLILYAIGVVLGYLLFIGAGQEILFQDGFPINFVYLYSAYIIIACIFTRNKERLEHEKLQAVKILAGAIAHEMRTPLLGLAAESEALEKVMPNLLASYEYAVKNGAGNVRRLPSQILYGLPDLPKRSKKSIEDTFVTIDILLMNLKDTLQTDTTERCSINACIREALEKYPLTAREKEMIQWEEGQDFQFVGTPLFLKHVFFNLLKNALYYVKKSGKGYISLRTSQEKNYNVVYFKDTGPGIDKESLDHIFDRFYTKTAHGTGIGLAFCKKVMEDLGGDITCHSKIGEYTEFTLKFPKEKISST